MTDDLISRADAITAMGDYLEQLNVSRRYAKSIINRCPSAQQWIPMTERLPNMDDICLVCGKNGGMYVARFWTNGNLILWTKTGTGKFVNPVAWMPLPEPYEVEE